MRFSGLADRLAEVRGRIAEAVARGGHGQEVRIVAVTKTHGPEVVEAAWAAGLRDVGENKVQEALRKQDALASRPAGPLAGLRWHLIGHLQTNKVKAVPRFGLFHALDRDRLADALDGVGRREDAPLDVLVQVNVSGEGSKGGYVPADLPAEAERLSGLAGIRVRGVMTMAPFDAEEGMLRRVFAGARAAGAVLREAGHPATELSMGMSGDYAVAVEEGATIVRLGTVLFGERG
jgi:PLP dependent protein